MIKTDKVIVVEGKYDKIKLSSIVDTTIITTGGFDIYTDRKKQQLIRNLAKNPGIIVLTDSDVAGFRIRRFINGMVGSGEVLHAYIPDVYGKESRKYKPSKEGKLGVEGVPVEVIKKALEEAGVSDTFEREKGNPITKQDFYFCGLTGGENSSERREKLIAELGLPEHITTNSLIQVLGHIMSREEFLLIVRNLFYN